MTDFNKFERVTVDGYAFADANSPDVHFDWRFSNLSFSMVLESGTGVVEYSFNGTTLHGDLEIGTPTEAIFFDNRHISKIWFRAKTGEAYGATVRIEGWSH